MAIDNNLLSIDSDDDNEDYKAFDEYLTDDTNRKKKKALSEIEEMGNQYLKEIDRKKKDRELKQIKLIPYILRYCKTYSKEELLSYSFEDVKQIYNEIKVKNRPAIVKFFYFLFNIE